jgi:hypothetical protein
MLDRLFESCILEGAVSIPLLDFILSLDMFLAGADELRDDIEEIRECGWDGENDFRNFWELSY